MSDLKLFRVTDGTVSELPGSASTLERSLQRLIERNLEALLGIRLLKTEHITGQTHGGRIDSLGLDENSCPVIIEYKRSTNENVINQGLFYLDWLLDHKADFKLLVLDRFGREEADAIDWSAPRLVCIAADFTRYDEHAVRQINRNIELVRYRHFGEDLLLLDLVTAVSANGATETEPSVGKPQPVRPSGEYKTISDTLATLDGPVAALYSELRSWLLGLGDDVQEKTLKYYLAYRRLKNFACVEVHPVKVCLTIYARLDPSTVQMEDGFTRDVSNVGHYGTGDVEIVVQNPDDLERAKPLLVRSYEEN